MHICTGSIFLIFISPLNYAERIFIDSARWNHGSFRLPVCIWGKHALPADCAKFIPPPNISGCIIDRLIYPAGINVIAGFHVAAQVLLCHGIGVVQESDTGTSAYASRTSAWPCYLYLVTEIAFCCFIRSGKVFEIIVIFSWIFNDIFPCLGILRNYWFNVIHFPK